MSDNFLDLYRSVALPRLKRSAAFLAILVVTGDRDFHWAVAEMQGEAIRMGASLLPEPTRRLLVGDVIPTMLLRATERVQPAWDAAQARATAVAIDVRRSLARVQ